jgi:hypothetical protein
MRDDTTAGRDKNLNGWWSLSRENFHIATFHLPNSSRNLHHCLSTGEEARKRSGQREEEGERLFPPNF